MKGKANYRAKAPAPRRRRKQRRTQSRATPEFASLKQTLQLNDDPINQILVLDNIALSQFDRATLVARAYQYFRITKVEMRFKPKMDTFTDSGLNSVPYFHYLIDKGEVLFPTLSGFSQMLDSGCKPIRFDEKTLTVSWRPGVSYGVQGDSTIAPTTVFNRMLISPWLTTNQDAGSDPNNWTPSIVPHKGLIYGVQATVSTPRDYEVELTVHFQFKKPLSFAVDAGENATPALKKVIPNQPWKLVPVDPPAV